MTTRIKDIVPEVTNPAASDFLAIDGAGTARSTIQNVVNSGAPIASQAEAEAGADNAKRMTALRTKQYVDGQIGNTIASAASGALANTAVQPGDLGNSAGLDIGTTAGTVAAGDDERIVLGGTSLQPEDVGRDIGKILAYESIADIPSIMLDSKIIFKKNAPANADGWDVRIWRDATGIVGGTPGFVNSALMVDTQVGADNTSYEWNALFKLDSYAAGGENVAAYFQSTKHGAGQVWSGCFETREVPTAPYGPITAIENALSVNGPDPDFRRLAFHVIANRYDEDEPVPEVGYGVLINSAWNGDVLGVESARFRRPLGIDGSWTDEAIFAFHREGIGSTITSDVGLLNMFVNDGGGLNSLSVHMNKVTGGGGWTHTGVLFDHIVDGVLVGRLAMNGDQSIELNTSTTVAKLVHGGGWVIPTHATDPSTTEVGQIVWLDGINRARIRGSDGAWHQFAMES